MTLLKTAHTHARTHDSFFSGQSIDTTKQGSWMLTLARETIQKSQTRSKKSRQTENKRGKPHQWLLVYSTSTEPINQNSFQVIRGEKHLISCGFSIPPKTGMSNAHATLRWIYQRPNERTNQRPAILLFSSVCHVSLTYRRLWDIPRQLLSIYKRLDNCLVVSMDLAIHPSPWQP